MFQFIILMFVYSSTCLGRFPAHHQELYDLQWQPLVLPLYRGDSHAVICGRAGRPARPRTQHDYHHNTKVKSEVATAVIELLMMGGKTPQTC
jgi:hypothetical protein